VGRLDMGKTPGVALEGKILKKRAPGEGSL